MTRQQDIRRVAALRDALATAVDSGQRARLALRVYRGDALVARQRPGEYVAAGMFVGMVGAFALMALGRRINRGPGGGSGVRQVRRGLDRVRAATVRIRYRRSPGKQEAADGDAPSTRTPDVTTLPVPSTGARVADRTGPRWRRRTYGAA
jgi:hypothetical protein